MHSVPRLLRILVRLDFIAAVVLTVLLPLVLLVRAVRSRREQVADLLGYWRASSLLMVSVYLLIGKRRTAFVSGIAARLLIPWSLRHASYTNDPRFTRWKRWITAYCLGGALLNLPLLACLRQQSPTALCRAYIEPTQEFGAVLHPGVSRETLGRVGDAGLLAFVVGAVLLWLSGRKK
ncbi:MAG: DUF3177 family protein [Chloroflexaceae bacterium]|nr:DUF3177 family protein [Chloroflexaceae bacterium]